MSIITQIGRENNISAEIRASRTVEDAGPYNFVNILMRTLLKAGSHKEVKSHREIIIAMAFICYKFLIMLSMTLYTCSLLSSK